MGGYLEIDQQGQRIHHGGDKGACHHCRVKSQALGQHRQRTAYQFRQDNGNKDGQGHHHCHRRSLSIQENDLGIHCHRQSCGTQQRYPQLLPQHPEDVLEFYVPQAHGTDHRYRGLTARIPRRIHQHGNKQSQGGVGCQRAFKNAQNRPGERGRYHQQQKPGDPVLPCLDHASLKVGFI